MSPNHMAVVSSGSVSTPSHLLRPVYLDRHPSQDYELVQKTAKVWIGASRAIRSRQLVVIKEVYHTTTLQELRRTVRIMHRHVAPVLALYCCRDRCFAVYEFLELDLFDVLPLATEVEIASVMAQARSESPPPRSGVSDWLQLLDGINYLLSESLAPQIHTIRISSYGVVKLGTALRSFVPRPTMAMLTTPPVMDRDYDWMTTSSRIEGNRFVIGYLEELLDMMSENGDGRSSEALGFLKCLRSGRLPDTNV